MESEGWCMSTKVIDHLGRKPRRLLNGYSISPGFEKCVLTRLYAAGITTVEQLTQMTAQEFASKPGFANESVTLMRERLAERGLAFKKGRCIARWGDT
jgi:hypothetical protein